MRNKINVSVKIGNLLGGKKVKSLLKNYGFIICMLTGIIAGCIVGVIWPGATVLEPLGTIFTNLMFCIVVPMVFCSIASAIANMSSAKRAGKIGGKKSRRTGVKNGEGRKNETTE